jgi:hypothetical protein
MIRTFKRVLNSNTWNEIHIVDTETGEYKHYMQDKAFGFAFSQDSGIVSDIGYKSVNEYLKTLKERNYLGEEVDYTEQIESERIGQINLKAEQERIKSNSVEYNRRLAALSM